MMGYGSDCYLGSCWARSWTKEKMMDFQTGIGLDYCLALRTACQFGKEKKMERKMERKTEIAKDSSGKSA
jgi:hypothetical protein